MIRIERNVSLQRLNTFGVNVFASFYTEVHDEQQLPELIRHETYLQNRRLILGGGSNMLFMNDFPGLIIRSALRGIEVVKEDEDFILVRAYAGEPWHELVLHCIARNWGGIENLSLIPGTAGAAPLQNIGAYGVEIKDVIECVTGFDLSTGERTEFSGPECHFSYRESIFKHELKEFFFISSITLRLTKRNHQLQVRYGAVHDALQRHQITHPSLQQVSEAICAIRQSKLPDPRVIGNAGSFFKNPTIPITTFESIQRSYPAIPSYPVDNQNVKVPAGWLIEQCGWKGKRVGDVGVHAQQALVLVNYGQGKGQEIFELAMKIKDTVMEKFGIFIIPEVNIIE